MVSDIREWTHVVIVNAHYLHQYSFCARVISSGLATRVILTQVPRGLAESGLDLLLMHRITWLLFGYLLNGTLSVFARFTKTDAILVPVLFVCCPAWRCLCSVLDVYGADINKFLARKRCLIGFVLVEGCRITFERGSRRVLGLGPWS
jgi:hypothetical protein